MKSTEVRYDIIAKQLTSLVCPVLLLWTVVYLLGWSLWLIAFYVITPYFAPFWLGPYVLTFIRTSLTNDTLPLHIRTLGLCRLFYHFFLKQPAFNVAWWIDEILFPLYHSTKINSPTFILGQPRSGTTKLLDILATNDKHVVALKFWELMYPILWIQYLTDFVDFYNVKYFGGRLTHLFNPFAAYGAKTMKMHRMGMDRWEEDDVLFTIHYLFSFAMFFEFPSKENMELNLNFRTLSESSRKRMFDIHRKTVQKVCIREGMHNLSIWQNGLCVGLPEESIPSMMKLLQGVTLDASKYDPLSNIEFKETMMNYMYRAHELEIEFIQELLKQEQHVQIIKFTELFEDIPGVITKAMLELGIPIPIEYKAFLLQEQKKQLGHTKTEVDKSASSIAEIERNCSTFYERLNFLKSKV
ncbi:hypothetical protein K7432_008117 [Basidiobolus ranarum]|uniref:Sulfotransferase n=1 Tax=Basidiobolus ranarum TaxID=34480 RepID=A0ABR2VZ35_9FUNG